MRQRYCWNGFVLDLDAFRLERAGRRLPLEPKAIELLALLIERPHHLFTKQEIFDAIWRGTAVTDHALTRVVAQLRRALADDPRHPKYIETVPSKGYRWVAAVDAQDVALAPDTAATAVPILVPPKETSPLGIQTSRAPRLAGMALVAAAVIGLAVFAAIRGDILPSSRSAGRADAVSSDPPHQGRVRWPVQLTTHAGVDMQPELSPLGDAVAYASDRTGAFEIYVRVFGEAPHDIAITRDGRHNVQPAWSPDGRYLAYHSARSGGIWVIPSRGGIPRQVAPMGSKPTWAPDGRRIAFQSDEHLAVTPTAYGAQQGSTIWTAGADGSDLRELTRTGQPAGGHAAPAWSPDGRYIAFTVFESGGEDGVWLLRLDTGETRAGWRRGAVFEVAFAPDGAALLATNGEASILHLAFDPAAGVLREPATVIPIAGVPGVRGVSIARDGRRVAFAGLALSSQIWAQPVSRDGIAAGSARPLTNDTSRRNSLPAVSPDGARIAYMSKRSGGAPHVWIMDIDGSNAVQVSADETGVGLPKWMPDGQRVAYLSRRDDTLGVWTVDVATRHEALLFRIDPARLAKSHGALEHGRLAEIDLSRSMRQAAFSVISPPLGRRVTCVTNLDPLTPRALTDGRSSIGYPVWSPDERRLAVEIKDGVSMQAGVVDVETGRLRSVTAGRGQTWPRSWSPDGRRIAAAALRHGVWDLRWIDVETGRQQTVTPAGGPAVYVRYPEWSAQGGIIVFERGEARGNIWTLTLR